MIYSFYYLIDIWICLSYFLNQRFDEPFELFVELAHLVFLLEGVLDLEHRSPSKEAAVGDARLFYVNLIQMRDADGFVPQVGIGLLVPDVDDFRSGVLLERFRVSIHVEIGFEDVVNENTLSLLQITTRVQEDSRHQSLKDIAEYFQT